MDGRGRLEPLHVGVPRFAEKEPLRVLDDELDAVATGLAARDVPAPLYPP